MHIDRAEYWTERHTVQWWWLQTWTLRRCGAAYIFGGRKISASLVKWTKRFFEAHNLPRGFFVFELLEESFQPYLESFPFMSPICVCTSVFKFTWPQTPGWSGLCWWGFLQSKLAKYKRDSCKWKMPTRNVATYAAITIPQRVRADEELTRPLSL